MAAAHGQSPLPAPLDYHGTWRGPVLFNIANPDTGAQGAPRVHDALLDIAQGGALRGIAPGAGCMFEGTAVDFVSAANATLNLSLSGCKDGRFNGRFAGRLLLNPSLGYASMRISGTVPGSEGVAHASAILRR